MTAATLEVGITGVGLLGPGFADWAQGCTLLADPARWVSAPTVVPSPGRLPPNERRRAELTVKASLVVADQACAAAAIDPALPATVFVSSSGEPAICHALCESLARPEPLVSPTRFTNSVQNAAAGYWHIATRSMQGSSSLGAYDASVAAGWLEAASQCLHAGHPVLLVACDVPYPEPLHRVRPVADVFAAAFVLQPPSMAAGAPRAALRWLGASAGAPTPCATAALESLRRAVPAARTLPLLEALAAGASRTVTIEGPSGSALQLEVRQ